MSPNFFEVFEALVLTNLLNGATITHDKESQVNKTRLRMVNIVSQKKKRDFEEIESIKEMTYDILERLKVRAFDEGEALAKLLCHEKKIKWCPYSKDNCPCPTVSLTHSRPCTCPLFDDVVVVQ